MTEEYGKRLWTWLVHTKIYFQVLVKWLSVAILVGISCGIGGSLFHIGVEGSTLLRMQYPWLLWMLPLAGILIVGCYHLLGTEGQGTNDIIEAVHHGKGLSIRLLPAIFLSTLLTHLCGGSAGREGAALQMGGTIGHQLGRLCRLDDRDLRTATMAGMAAFFTALFGTPLGGTMFAMMVISVGVFYHAALIPCLTASLVAYGVSLAVGISPTRFLVEAPDLAVGMLLRVVVLGMLCALVSLVFCTVLRWAGEWMQRRFPNPWLRAVTGGLAVIALTGLVGSRDYLGAGMEVVTAAIQEGTVHPAAFLLKILFTVITLGAGFKGGEVVPCFFIGATFGCVVGPLLGIPAGFAAALGLAAVFCGGTNCPMASTFLAIELFGDGGLIYFTVICGIGYMLSGYNGLYSSQTILYSKLKAEYINVQTNHHHAGDPHEEPPGVRHSER